MMMTERQGVAAVFVEEQAQSAVLDDRALAAKARVHTHEGDGFEEGQNLFRAAARIGHGRMGAQGCGQGLQPFAVGLGDAREIQHQSLASLTHVMLAVVLGLALLGHPPRLLPGLLDGLSEAPVGLGLLGGLHGLLVAGPRGLRAIHQVFVPRA